MADMGLSLGYGAGFAPDQLVQILKDRLLIQEQQRRQAELEAQSRYQQGMLGVAQDRNAISREEMAAEVPEREARVRLTKIQGDTGEYNLGQKRADDERAKQGRALFGQTAVGQKILPALDAGVPIADVDILDPENATAQRQRLEQIDRQGQWSTRAASMNQGGQNPYVSEWTVPTTNAQGQPVTQRWGIPRGGTAPVMIQEVGGKTTADIQNRMAYTQEFAKKLGAFESMVPFVASYDTTDSTGERLWGAVKGAGRQYIAGSFAGPALDPQGAFFTNLQDGLAMTGARVLGSNSQLSDQEREAAKKALFPKLTEPKQVMLAKIEFWKRATGMEDEAQQSEYIRQGLLGIFPGIGASAPITDPFAK